MNTRSFKVLLLAEAPMCENAGGISQTLTNIFCFLEPKDILCICPKNEVKDYPPVEKYRHRYLGYTYEYISLPPNRVTKTIIPLINWINNTINFWRPFTTIKKKISEFDPDVIVSCPNGVRGIIVHHNLLKCVFKAIIPYFMDDWMYQSRQRWLGGNIHSVIQTILTENRNWLMISDELTKVLSDRYNIAPNKLLVVHNPVDIRDAIIPEKRNADKIVLAYAGALWDMHMDALVLVAKAVNIIKGRMPVELVIYTSNHFWNWRKDCLEPYGVVYGGSLAYKDVPKYLSQAQALIVVASFRKELYTHARASLQTKVTDYLKCRRLVISVGPGYAANHNFLKKHQCGICIETNQIEALAGSLECVLVNIDQYDGLIANGWALLEREFTKTIVHEKVVNFLGECINYH